MRQPHYKEIYMIYRVEGHADSILPDGHNWKLVWSDEFDGTEIDMNKWSYRLHLGGKRHTCYTDDLVSLDGKGNAVFRLEERNGQYYSSTLQTGENKTDRGPEDSNPTLRPNGKAKFQHKYGYYECRCILQKENPWWSAFWLQSADVANEEMPPEKAGVEVDIMESFNPGRVIPHFNHWGGYGKGHKFANTAGFNRWATDEDAFDVGDGYHTFGVDWEPDGYTFYVDGVQSGKKIEAPVSDTEQFILVFTECKGYRGAIPGYIASDEFGHNISDKFIVDYVRVFDRV